MPLSITLNQWKIVVHGLDRLLEVPEPLLLHKPFERTNRPRIPNQRRQYLVRNSTFHKVVTKVQAGAVIPATRNAMTNGLKITGELSRQRRPVVVMTGVPGELGKQPVVAGPAKPLDTVEQPQLQERRMDGDETPSAKRQNFVGTHDEAPDSIDLDDMLEFSRAISSRRSPAKAAIGKDQ